MKTLFWHDYETWGVNPMRDKPAQFAGIRTDEALNVIGEPVNILCRPADDTLPHPEACLVTGLTPQYAHEHGMPENEFAAAVQRELGQAGTCGVGYNSIRFDDEVTRNLLYRNFYDPYGREWQQGNSRWDIIDMLRLCYVVRPEGINWPSNDDGAPSFRLELLTAANDLAHEDAHDALSDVRATIAMAALVRKVQPKLYQHAFERRDKKSVRADLALGSEQMRLHISSKFGAAHAYASLVLPVAMHPTNKNEIICLDLRQSPEPVFDLEVDVLAQKLFSPSSELPPGEARVPLKSVHLNRCPIVLTPALIDSKVAERMCIDVGQCEQHRDQYLQLAGKHGAIQKKLQSLFSARVYDNHDVEERLYDGFMADADKRVMHSVVTSSARQLADNVFVFEDERLPELFWRYRARNFPAQLTRDEAGEWREFCRIVFERELPERIAVLDKLQADPSLAPEKASVLEQLRQYFAEKTTI